MEIDYDHARHRGTVEEASIVLSAAFGPTIPRSLLDVGCGTGTWLRAAVDLGVNSVLGVDGADVPQKLLHVEKNGVVELDLTQRFDLGRRFDLAICLEVAEHLPESASDSLISSIVAHSDGVLFSAACPGQYGQHHINCQWLDYWQRLFNSNGFVCDDSIRWRFWDDKRIEPWYRQNMFLAHRAPENAGREPRLERVIHPEIYPEMLEISLVGYKNDYRISIEQGGMPALWYVRTLLRAGLAKLARRLAA